MTTAKPSAAEDDLSKACAKVGRFLHEFVLVEQEINNGIVQILDLKRGAADFIVRWLSFRRKADLLKFVALETAPKKEKEGISELFDAIEKENKHRNLMAHNVFEPAADEGVQCKPTVAKDGTVKKPDPPWTKQGFKNSYKRLHDIREKLTELRPSLTITTEEGRTQIFHHYLYTPGLVVGPPDFTRPLLSRSKNKPS